MRWLGLSLLLALSACRCEEKLPVWPESKVEGRLSLVEAANPGGGAEATAGASDLSVPPRSGDLGWWVDMAAAPDGRLHLAYTDAYNGELHYAEETPEGWKITVVDHYGAVGKYPAIAVDAEGRPHILYYNQDKARLLYTTRVGREHVDPKDRRRPYKAAEDWFFEVLDEGKEIGMAGELRALPDGSIHAVYYSSKEQLFHLRRPPSALGEHRHWERRIVDDAAGGSHSIVIGFVAAPDGTLHLSYANWTVFDSELRYARLAPGAEAWEHETLKTDPNAGWKSGIVLSSPETGRRPIIAYLTLRNRRIMLAKQGADGTWTHTPLVGDANTFDFLADAEGHRYLPYEHLPGVGLADARLRVLVSKEGTDTWRLWTLGQRGAMSSYLAAALGPEGRLSVALYDGGIRGVKVWRAGEEAP